jgi:hypothetical protein
MRDGRIEQVGKPREIDERPRGDSVEHVVALDGLELRARCDSSVSIPPGTEVAVVVPEDGCSLVPPADAD